MIHLSAEDISRWMLGERPPHLKRHVALCTECRGELDQLERSLAHFRGAIREATPPATPAWRPPAIHGSWFSWPRLALASATLCLLVALPVYWTGRARERAAEAARADVLLLERVDSAISRAVPEPMEPLVSLVSWNSSPAEQRKKVERQ